MRTPRSRTCLSRHTLSLERVTMADVKREMQKRTKPRRVTVTAVDDTKRKDEV